ncbi:hypothetical protein [Thiomicrorhabdus sp.]|uniref:hypothetical protein n=1 Tax=Thiomicrorhabdus sp. TaxID=2039724 RepID=UPI0029C948F1|nr:hypothetical protein [Thiomicrorhabdus sp.]
MIRKPPPPPPPPLQVWHDFLVGLGGDRQVSLQTQSDQWRLLERTLLNPGSQGMPTYHLSFEPDQAQETDWQAADDLVELAYDGITRQYSIASIPDSGSLQLLVRQVQLENGKLGCGSGFLTDGLKPGDSVNLTVQANRSFHLDKESDAPLILIGNGTGLAGLRAHLLQRIIHGHFRNWLFFGERSRAQDLYFGEELHAMLSNGHLAKMSLAFSRDDGGYVQDQLAALSEEIRSWVQEGAFIMVCGSADTMAKAVDEALQTILESDYRQLVESGRYLRDIY